MCTANVNSLLLAFVCTLKFFNPDYLSGDESHICFLHALQRDSTPLVYLFSFIVYIYCYWHFSWQINC